ncbi:MAG: tRNA pseudouridine(13) synthase TruD, partial [Shewanella sp.]
LWGRGMMLAQGDAAAMETAALVGLTEDCYGLEHAGLEQERRPLLLEPQALKYQQTADGLVLDFILPAGSFATSLLRELVNYQDVKESQWRASLASEAQDEQAIKDEQAVNNVAAAQEVKAAQLTQASDDATS